MSIEAEILAVEARRCAAITKSDIDTLRSVLADDYVHVFGSGNVTDKRGYVQTIADGPRAPERSNMRVRVYDDVAVITGDLLNHIEQPDGTIRTVDTVATQVLRKQRDGWVFVSCQLTPRRAPAA